jgi:hypothetical protein
MLRLLNTLCKYFFHHIIKFVKNTTLHIMLKNPRYHTGLKTSVYLQGCVSYETVPAGHAIQLPGVPSWPFSVDSSDLGQMGGGSSRRVVLNTAIWSGGMLKNSVVVALLEATRVASGDVVGGEVTAARSLSLSARRTGVVGSLGAEVCEEDRWYYQKVRLLAGWVGPCIFSNKTS